MNCDPDPIAERQRTVSRSDLKMLNDDEQSLEETADIDPKLVEEFDL